MTRRTRRVSEQLWRSRILFAVGITGFFYELLIDRLDRPSILIIVAGMMGLPAFFNPIDDRDEDDSKT